MRCRGGTPGRRHRDAREFAAERLAALCDEPADQVVAIVGEQALAVWHRAKAQMTNDGHGQARESRHVGGSVPSANAAAILVVGDVLDVMHGFDRPVATVDGKELLRSSLFGVEAGDDVGDLARGRRLADAAVGVRVNHALGALGDALDAGCLFGIREGQTIVDVQDLDGAGLDPTVALFTCGD